MASSRGSPRPASVPNLRPASADALRPEPTAIGTRRRLRALAARAWSPEAIEHETGIPAAITRRELDGRDGIADIVASAYDRLWDRQPPSVTPEQRKAARAIEDRAARSGWPPPMAWDDDLIDRPDGQPEPGWRPSGGSSRRVADLVEDAEFVRDNGYRQASIGLVAERLGIRQDRLMQAYARNRRRTARPPGRAAGAEPEAEAG
jgi:hypothetical protein